MQQVSVEGQGRIGATMGRMYANASLDAPPSRWVGYPEQAGALIARLMRGQEFQMEACRPWEPMRQVGTDRAMVAFSGGKDSTAAAIKLRAMGKTVGLYYMGGINPSYPHERRAALQLAAALDMRIATRQAKLSGTSNHTENPVKNQYILAHMVEFGRISGISEYASGALADDRCADLAFGSGYSDGRELFEAADPLLATAVDGYLYHHGLVKNNTDSLLTIAKASPGLLAHTLSCMMPDRYKGNLKLGNEKKYGVKLMPGRCGSCYKCASEWLHLALLGAIAWNDGFAEHSIGMLVRGAGQIYRGGAGFSREGLLNTFIDPAQLPAVARLY